MSEEQSHGIFQHIVDRLKELSDVTRTHINESVKMVAGGIGALLSALPLVGEVGSSLVASIGTLGAKDVASDVTPTITPVVQPAIAQTVEPGSILQQASQKLPESAKQAIAQNPVSSFVQNMFTSMEHQTGDVYMTLASPLPQFAQQQAIGQSASRMV